MHLHYFHRGIVMAGEVRTILDLMLGCCHGYSVVGYCLFSQSTVFDNDFNVVRTSDIIQTTCPICGVGFAVMSSPDVHAEPLKVVRMGDSVVFSSGSGIAAGGSPDVFSNS